MYSSWKVSQLKDELKKRGASMRGKKTELIERLEAYDKNQLGYLEPIETEEPALKTPNNDLFRDINSDTPLPQINKTVIRQYLNFTDKKMEKCVQLYESRHLLSARISIQNAEIFIKGNCRKTMKNHSYEVNLKLDVHGNILGASCECPAGSGQEVTCKHVGVLLLGIENMVRCKIMLLFEVCTQKLQQFHVPKKHYTGTPVHAEKLPRKKSHKTLLVFEPYPIKKINKKEYNTRFLNIISNFPNSNMPLKQLINPANPYAIENDHSYSSYNAKESVLIELGHKFITLDKIKDIEESTRGQVNNTIWHEQRQHRLTASKFHTICHLSSKSMPSFAKQIRYPNIFTSRATNHGIINESVALEKYAREFNLSIQPCGLVISAVKPYLAASPDGLLGSDTIVEVKCPYASRYREVNPKNIPYLFEDSNGVVHLKRTSPYFYQIQGQLFCTNRKFCNLIIFTYVELRVLYICRDDHFITEMLQKLDHFYECYFKQVLFNEYVYYGYENFKK